MTESTACGGSVEAVERCLRGPMYLEWCSGTDEKVRIKDFGDG